MAKVSYKGFEYQVFNDGYELWGENGLYITQHAPYDKSFVPDGSYEDNAKAQIDELTTPAPEPVNEEDALRADIDFLALMAGVDLPSRA